MVLCDEKEKRKLLGRGRDDRREMGSRHSDKREKI